MKQLPYPVVTSTNLPGFKLHSQGKVRDIYEIDENTLLLITTDRMSAFDVILGDPIPWKGVILNQLTLFWMNKFSNIIPNHILESDVSKYPAALQPYRDQLIGRSVLARKAQPLKAECIVRGYIAGSGWKSYKENRSLCGYALPEGLKESDKLPSVLF
ncbi:MAG: phosphoribosylaminoimidazolesuccinocarboxamide synthase, partial [Mailhella sp.]